jgi:CO/xanthine dehydrogenase Mo-binding subunit
VTNIDGSPRADTPRPVLATERVRHVGDPVALVVAETLAQAKDAAELIAIDYAPLPAVADTRSATLPEAPRAWDHIANNLCFDIGARLAKAMWTRQCARGTSPGSSSSTTASLPIRSNCARRLRIDSRAGAPRFTRRARDRT